MQYILIKSTLIFPPLQFPFYQPYHYFSLPTSCPLFLLPFFFKPTGPAQWCLYACGCGTIHWNVNVLSVAAYLKKTNFPFFIRHQLPIGLPQMGQNIKRPSQTHAGLIMSRSYASSHSCCVFMLACSHYTANVFCCRYPLTLAQNLSTSSSKMTFKLLGECVIWI